MPNQASQSNGFEPIEIVNSDEEVERVDVFSIDGVMYSMPKEVNAAIALRAVEIIRREGDMAVVPFMFAETVGRDGYEALKNCTSLKAGQLKQVVRIISDSVLGAVELSAGE